MFSIRLHGEVFPEALKCLFFIAFLFSAWYNKNDYKLEGAIQIDGTEIKLSNNLTTIPEGTFLICSSLEEIKFGEMYYGKSK